MSKREGREDVDDVFYLLIFFLSICSQEFLSNKGRPDFKGYYSALGLDPSGERVSQDDIKRAFREAAKKWHPDRHTDAAGKRIARDRFHEVRTAYETLRDPERRRHYDLGQTPPPQQP